MPGEHIPHDTIIDAAFFNELRVISIHACYTCVDCNTRYMDRLPDDFIHVLKNMSSH